MSTTLINLVIKFYYREWIIKQFSQSEKSLRAHTWGIGFRIFAENQKINMRGKQISTNQHDDDEIATQTVLNVMSRARLSSWNVSVLKAPPWQAGKSLQKPLRPRHKATPPDSEWNVFRAEEPLKNIQSDITALPASFLRVWGTWREGGVDLCRNLMGRKEEAESRVKMLVLHVEAAGGTQERLAGAVCAMTFQAFCWLRGPCGGGSQGWVQTGQQLMRCSLSLAAMWNEWLKEKQSRRESLHTIVILPYR